MAIDLSKFKGALPYDSQLYGIYQPLLGWKSGLQSIRLRKGLIWLRQSYLSDVTRLMAPNYSIRSAVSDSAEFDLGIANPSTANQAQGIAGIDAIVTQQVIAEVQKAGLDNPDSWKKYTSPDFLNKTLRSIHRQIQDEFLTRVRKQAMLVQTHPTLTREAGIEMPNTTILSSILQRESIAAGVFSRLNQENSPEQLMSIFHPISASFVNLGAILQLLDPAKSDLASAALSPIGVVHLFREYFFEFASFLGSPVQHVWLSPGGSVELIEVSTRKSIVERTIEQSFESIQKSEKDTTTQDELSDAVKQENSSDTKLGVSATSNTNYNTGFVNGSVTVSGSFNLEQQQKLAREQTHKSMRQQTQKLSSEIRQSYKSTLRTVTETTDTSSKRYVLQNTTSKLINYELRRKMRQVGVQLQDYGTRLCWQTYVDDPGDTLGLPNFVHAAPPPDLQNIKVPEQPPAPAALARGDAIVVRGGWDHGDVSQYNFVPVGAGASIVAPSGYIYDHAELVVQQGPPWAYRVWPATPSDTTIQIGQDPPINAGSDFIKTVGNAADGTAEQSVTQVLVGVVTAPTGLRDDNKYDIAIQITPIFRPSLELLKATHDAYMKSVDTYNEQTKQAYQQAMFQSIRDRVKLASNIQPRDFTELREEERIVVYRRLVEQLLKVAGVSNVDPHVRHVFSELVQSMFDMDNMLYFVAPDWWMPRQHVTAADALSGLGLSGADQPAFTPGSGSSGGNVVGWGGPRAIRPDNYYITEDSAPAKLGSSLGWLLQLDGDNFRNAFLNAPWVKAVIPIQEGHEWKALDWLSSSVVEGSDGLDALYQESFPGEKSAMLALMKKYTAWPDPSLGPRYASLDPAFFTILDAIRYLIVAIQGKQAAARQKIADPSDPKLSYLPSDQVYEHGFDPLSGGFVAEADPKNPFSIFDQWIEVLPTDQIVPVEVQYDPKTGLQV
ncbi:MAG TPA: hypothetical protein VMO00_15820 [Methylomirabilota bacterium]|nr:hypothetical protein [Methylomirabilota bacterium]